MIEDRRVRSTRDAESYAETRAKRVVRRSRMGKWWSLAALGVTMLHTGCGERQTPAPTKEAPVNTAAQATGIAGTNPSAALVIIGIYPPSAKAGDGFNKQKTAPPRSASSARMR